LPAAPTIRTPTIDRADRAQLTTGALTRAASWRRARVSRICAPPLPPHRFIRAGWGLDSVRRAGQRGRSVHGGPAVGARSSIYWIFFSFRSKKIFDLVPRATEISIEQCSSQSQFLPRLEVSATRALPCRALAKSRYGADAGAVCVAQPCVVYRRAS